MEISLFYNPFNFKSKVFYSHQNKNGYIKLKGLEDKHISKWIDILFQTILTKFSVKEIKINFSGSKIDFKILKDILQKYKEYKIEFSFDEIIVFIDIKNQILNAVKRLKEIEELKDFDTQTIVKKAFALDTEIAVIATLSSGKSTLINYFLQKNILPSKNESCTAMICKIFLNKNIPNNVYNFKGIKKNNEIILKEDIDVNFISECQKQDSEYSHIEIQGNFDFDFSDFTRLIFIDTPGPNSTLNKNHKENTIKYIRDTNLKPLIMYVLNATQFAIEDDHTLLKEIAESFKVSDNDDFTISKRFIFVLNKIDNFDPEIESIEELISHVKDYLLSFGIKDPIILPISAEIGKLIKMKKNNEQFTQSQKIVYSKIKDIFLEEKMNMINYLPVTNVKKQELEQKALKLKDDCLVDDAVLIYSGMAYLNEYINDYIQMYSVVYNINYAVSFISKNINDVILNDKFYPKLKDIILKKENLHKNIELTKKILEESQIIDDLQNSIVSMESLIKVDLSNFYNKNLTYIEDLLSYPSILFSHFLLLFEKIKDQIENNFQIFVQDILNETVKKTEEILKNLNLEFKNQYENISLAYTDTTLKKELSFENIKIDFTFSKISKVRMPNFFAKIQTEENKNILVLKDKINKILKEKSTVSGFQIIKQIKVYLKKENEKLNLNIQKTYNVYIKEIQDEFFEKIEVLKSKFLLKQNELKRYMDMDLKLEEEEIESKQKIEYLISIDNQLKEILSISKDF